MDGMTRTCSRRKWEPLRVLECGDGLGRLAQGYEALCVWSCRLGGAGVTSLPPCPSRTFMEQKWQTAQDLLSHLLNPLNELKSRGFDTLLQGLFGDLKVAAAVAPAEPRAGGRWGGLGGGWGWEWQKRNPRFGRHGVGPAVVRLVLPR